MVTEPQDAAARRDLLPAVEAGLEPAVVEAEIEIEIEAVAVSEPEPLVPLQLEVVAVQRDVAGVQAEQVQQPV